MPHEYGAGAFVAFALLLSGCASPGGEAAAVAKDWALVVRASQVIPVYPLTEDLRPGDLFLVDTPLQEQARQYRERGFLPVDQHLARLDLAREDEGPAARAAFPSYVFRAERQGGLRLALPLDAVDVGLALLGTGSATASVTIAEAHTRGVPFERVLAPVGEWARLPEHRVLLGDIRRQAGQEVFLRVVTRVYSALRVTVSLAAARAADVRTETTRPEPGADGRIRVLRATERSVTLDERFGEPLVFGYVGFDFPVLEDGVLGPPAATRARLAGDLRPAVRPGRLTPGQEDHALLHAAVCSLDAGRRRRVFDTAAEDVGGGLLDDYRVRTGAGEPPQEAFAAARRGYLVGRGPGGPRARAVHDALLAAWRAERGDA